MREPGHRRAAPGRDTDESTGRGQGGPGTGTVRNRLLLPLLIPLGALVAILLLVLGFSRILLGVPAVAAPYVTLVVAVGTLAVAARVAALPRIRLSHLSAALGVVAGVAMLAGGLVAASVTEGPPAEAPGEAAAPPPPPASPPASPPPAGCAPSGTALRVVAEGIAFDQGCLAAPAGNPFSIEFTNDDPGIPHNVAIYTDPSAATPLFVGEIFPGPDARTYEVPALDPGTYFFRCDVHPTQMTGTFVVQ